MRLPKRRSLLGYAQDQVRRNAHRLEAEYEQKKIVMQAELTKLTDEIAELESMLELELSRQQEQGGTEG